MKLILSTGDERTAFTLMELMVVIALIAILSAMIVPEMKGTYEDALLRSTSRDLVNAFDIASSRAVSLNQVHRVRIEPKTGRYVIEKRVRETEQGEEFTPLKDVSEAEGKLDTRISLEMQKPGETAADSQEQSEPMRNTENTRTIEAISFYGDGTADATELLLRDRQGFRMALRINPTTARVKITELERE